MDTRSGHFQSGIDESATPGQSLQKQSAHQTALGVAASVAPHSVLDPMMNVPSPLNGRSPQYAAETAGGTRPSSNGMSQSTHDARTMGPYQSPSGIQ